MTVDVHPLREMVEVLNDGALFYADAAGRTHNAAYRTLFRRMANAKQDLIDSLNFEIRSHGASPVEHGTLAGIVRQNYTDLRAALSDHPDIQYVRQLEETEDRILKAFRDVSTLSPKAAWRDLAQRHLPEVKRMHDEMRGLKHNLMEATG